MPRQWREVLTAALVAAALAGCAGVPTSGPVRQHDPGDQGVDSTVNVAAVPPAPNASATLIVEGFLHAMGTDEPGFAVARQYLTEQANRTWRPEEKTSIYGDGYQAKATDTSTQDQPTIALDGILTGTLSPSGEYREGSGGLRHDFGLVRTEDGNWRISKPPAGLLISRYQFTTNYVARTLHYLDALGTVLVPDLRFFAQNAATLDALAGAQLAGPSGWLAPALRADPGAGLVLDRVDFSGQGVANVHLSGTASRLDDNARRTLMAELTTTLLELPQVTGVQFTVAATLLPRPGATQTTLTREDFEELAPVDLVSPGRLLTVREGRVRLVQATAPWLDDEAIAPALTQPGSIAARHDLALIASVDPGGTALSVAGVKAEEARTPFAGVDLLRPDFSRQRELWAIGNRDGADGFRVFAGDELRPVPVSVADMPTERVRAFRISPDGARVALVLDGPEVEQVGIARIVRAQGGIRLEEFREVTVSPPAAERRRLLDVGWKTATQLLVLVSQEMTSSVVQVDQDSAIAEDIGPAELAGLTELAVIPGRQPVLRGTGSVFRYEGSFNWKPTTQAVDAVTYSG